MNTKDRIEQLRIKSVSLYEQWQAASAEASAAVVKRDALLREVISVQTRLEDLECIQQDVAA